MRRLRRLPTCLPILLLLILVPALFVAVRRSHSSPAAPADVTFVDSGQALGSADGRDVALGDVDGDGDLDAMVANADAPLTLWLNQGGTQGGTAGTFADSGQELGGSDGAAVIFADLDGDGDPDAVAVTNDSADALHILVNQGPVTPGTFARNGQTFAAFFNNVAAGNVDGDADVDLFITSHGRGNQVLLNEGGAPVQFVDSGQSLGSDGSADVALGDLDGDGDLDAFVGNLLHEGEAGNTVWINQGGDQGGALGDFADSGQSLGDGNTAAAALGDVDGDGNLDALTANLGEDGLWLNDGAATFSDGGQSLDGRLSTDGALADLDDDGDLDAFITNIAGGNTVWFNDGSGALFDGGQLLGASDSYGLALGDVDGDGDRDAFVVNDGPDRLWLNEPAAPGDGADVAVIMPRSGYSELSDPFCPPLDTSFIVTVRNNGPEPATNVTAHAREGNLDGGGSWSTPANSPPTRARETSSHQYTALLTTSERLTPAKAPSPCS